MAQYTDQELRFGRRWWWAIRRAYDVPDIVTDANASAFLAQKFRDESDDSYITDDVNIGALAQMIVLGAGRSGALDALLLDPDTDLRNLCQMAAQELITGPEAKRAAVAEAMRVAEKVTRYILANPGNSEPPYPLEG